MNRLFITRKLIKHSLRLIKSISFFAAAAAVFSGCGKDESKAEYIAKVNDTYLTSKELAEMTDTMNINRFYRNEIVRSWINRELLYQEAMKEGILDQEKYDRIVTSSKKELAASLLVSRFLDKTQVNFGEEDIEEYYNRNVDEFELLNNGYLVNEAEFLNEEEAIKFRNSVIEKNWEDALSEIENDSLLVYEKNRSFLYEYEINPPELSRILKELNTGELSVIINKGDSSFYFVQLLGNYTEGTIPPLDIIKEEVEKRYLVKKRKEALDQFIKELYTNNEIKIRD
jgi:hypothetical protein